MSKAEYGVTEGYKTITLPRNIIRAKMLGLMAPLLDDGTVADPVAIFDEVAAFEGLDIYARATDFGQDIGCYEYLFATELGDRSVLDKDGHHTADLILSPDAMLRMNGYQPLFPAEDEKPGDVVVYTSELLGGKIIFDYSIYGSPKLHPERFRAIHFGLYLGKGRVRSKFGRQGHVFEHPLESLPLGFGDQAWFYRKTEGK